MQDELILKRVSPPGKQDTAPLGTKCIVTEFGEPEIVYIQKNDDENDPRWEMQEQKDDK